jgi:hypothetical protein
LLLKRAAGPGGERAKRRFLRRWKLKQFFRYGWRELPLYFVLMLLPLLKRVIPGLNVAHSALYLKYTAADGEVWDFGLVGRHLVVTAGKNYVAACFDNTSEPENLKYHGFGTGTTAAAAGDTALQTELTTQYATDNTRPTGSQAHSTNTYTTVATLTPDAAVAITEWGLLSQAATGGGTMLDRQVFSAVNLNGTGDSLQATYVLTIS